MKIKRFFESELQGPDGSIDLTNDISTQRVEEIIKDITTFLDRLDESHTTLKKFEEELTKYKSSSKKGNDQIDDSVIQLQQVNKTIESDVKSKLDDIVDKLKNYIEDGRNYIYTD
jgi:anti-sigma28 factor (negative regulator of flagellin synthesis)